ncbi:hypothetical protein [Paenibacillus sp. J2TS4]|uniref:hypothetical protein n=1 Tax=Paenibacillus sp. J2TS4 TaxID=2807194 RepID=UPI001BCC17CD|nr:hypothetical protein [Paenibacillus sp. J2TS4]
MKKVIAFLIVGMIIAGLLLAIENSFVNMNRAINEFSSGVLAERLKIVLYSIGLGIVFEWKKVVKMGKGGYSIHSSYILPLVLCLVFAIIPPFFVISYGFPLRSSSFFFVCIPK